VVGDGVGQGVEGGVRHRVPLPVAPRHRLLHEVLGEGVDAVGEAEATGEGERGRAAAGGDALVLESLTKAFR
jgi:hypothetical protein